MMMDVRVVILNQNQDRDQDQVLDQRRRIWMLMMKKGDRRTRRIKL